MSVEAAIVLAVFAIVVVLGFVLIRSKKAEIEVNEAELQHQASRRGWTFTKTRDGGYDVYTFTGTTDGVTWETQTTALVPGGNTEGGRHVACWHGKWSPGVTAPLFAMGVPYGKEASRYQWGQAGGFVTELALKAAAFAYGATINDAFGPEAGAEVDAATLQPVKEPRVPGFIVMASNVDEAKRLLTNGLQQALITMMSSAGNMFSKHDPPRVLLRPNVISLARKVPFRDADELDHFIQTGVGLTKAVGRQPPPEGGG